MSLHRISAVIIGLLLAAAAPSLAEDCAKAKDYYTLGNKLIKFTERRAAFQQAVNLCPTFAEAHVNLADAHENLAVTDSKQGGKTQEHFDKAAAHYQEGMRLNPRLFEAHIGLAQVYAAFGLYHKAEQCFTAALELRPRDEKLKAGLESVRSTIAQEAAADQKAGKDGFKKAHDIVQRVTSSDLGKTMGLMGPANFTEVRARVRFPNIIFDGWSSKLNRKETTDQLGEIGKALSSPELQDYDFRIEGHANTVGMDKKGGENKLAKLSEERAEAVKKFLVTKYRLPTNRIDVRGFGCARLQFPDDTDEHREKNRRVEIVFRKEGGE